MAAGQGPRARKTAGVAVGVMAGVDGGEHRTVDVLSRQCGSLDTAAGCGIGGAALPQSLAHHAGEAPWKYLASVELIFIAAYLVFVLVRAANPDLWHAWRGGEKPMELSYLIAVVKSSTFPPYDPWYAGGFINYYYYGFVVVGALIRLTGIVPEVAYNLALPMLFAFTLMGAFSVGYNLAEVLRQRSGGIALRWSPVWAGAGAALLVVVLANVDGAAQLLQGAWRSSMGEHFGNFDFWRSSRLMPGQTAINEFPFWTFLFGDLHAHLISLPFQVLAIGLTVNLVLGARKAVPLRKLLPALAGLAFVVGAFAAINTWETPAYLLLGFVAIAIVLLVRGDPPDLVTVAKGLLLAALFWVVLYWTWFPFHQHYEVPSTGVKMSQWRTVLWHYLAIHALLLFAVVSWLVFEARQRFAELNHEGRAKEAARTWLRRVNLRLATVALVVAGGLLLLVDAWRQWLTATLLSLLILAAMGVVVFWLVRRNERAAPVHLLLLAMLTLALGDRRRRRSCDRRERHRPDEYCLQAVPERMGAVRYRGRRGAVAHVGGRRGSPAYGREQGLDRCAGCPRAGERRLSRARHTRAFGGPVRYLCRRDAGRSCVPGVSGVRRSG